MMTNTMANQEHRPYPPEQFLTTDLHAAECQPKTIPKLTSNLFLQTAHDVNETLSFTGFFSSTIACCDLLQQAPHALLSFLHDYIRIGDKLQIRDNAALGDTLINFQFWLVTGNTPTKKGSASYLSLEFTQYWQ